MLNYFVHIQFEKKLKENSAVFAMFDSQDVKEDE